MDLGADLGPLLGAALHLTPLAAVGWVVRIPLLDGQEGHEAITRAAWEGMELTAEQRRALIRGVRAPDVGVVGVLTSALPFAQRRHALRAWSGTTTADGIREMRDFVTGRHLRALALPNARRRWAAFGEVLHCLQDSYSAAHAERRHGRIVRMRHWGPLDRVRHLRSSGHGHDEHRFPTDARDRARRGGSLTDEALAAVSASRRYLELAVRQSAASEPGEAEVLDLAAFLDECLDMSPTGP